MRRVLPCFLTLVAVLLGSGAASAEDTDKFFVLDATATPGTGGARLSIAIRAQGLWKWNGEYPFELTLDPQQGVTPSTERLTQADVRVSTGGKTATVDLGLATLASNVSVITGRVSFALCLSEDRCRPFPKVAVRWAVADGSGVRQEDGR